MPRTKTVFLSHQVIHLWAAHNRGDAPGQCEARTASRNVSFSGPALYSYRQEIARFANAPDGTPFVWINAHSYSVTTARHQRRAGRALPGGVRQVALDTWSVAGDPRKAIDHLLVAAQEHSNKAARSRNNGTWYREYRVTPRLDAAAWLGEKYGIALGTLQMELRQMERRREGHKVWANIAKFFGEYDEASRTIWRNLAKAFQQIECGRAWLEHREPAREALDRYGRWLYSDYGLPTMLRLKADGETVETNRGAEFPLRHGLRALPVIRACRERNEGWERNGHKLPLGHFQIDRILPNGDVKAGCHYVPFFAIEYLANQMPDPARWNAPQVPT